MMALSMEEIQRQNYEKSLYFMQEEHAKTLKDLHEEIRKLQARCSELTFQNAMNSTYQVDEDQYTEKIEALQKELGIMKRKAADLVKDSDKSNSEILLLRTQLANAERSLDDERQKRTSERNSLNRELECRASAVARLTAQLHQLKRAQASKGADNSPTDGNSPRVDTSSRHHKHRRYRPVSAASNDSNSPRDSDILPPTTSIVRPHRRSLEGSIADPSPFIGASYMPTPPRSELCSKTPLPPIRLSARDTRSRADRPDSAGDMRASGVTDNLQDTAPDPRGHITSQLVFTPSPKRAGRDSVSSAIEVQRLAVGKAPKSRCGYTSPAAGGADRSLNK